MAGPLDRARQHALVPGAGSSLSASADLARLGDIALQLLALFVVDVHHLIRAELAHSGPAAEAAVERST